MPLTPRQHLMLHLAGTVRLPSPAPATGCIWTVAPKSGKVHYEDIVLRIVHRVGGRLYIERIVRMPDVRAILASFPKLGDLPAEHGYRTYEQFRAAATEFAQAHRNEDTVWLTDAVAFVNETAPVVLATEAAMTAAESADYYPPIVSDGRPSAQGLKARGFTLEDCNESRGLDF